MFVYCKLIVAKLITLRNQKEYFLYLYFFKYSPYRKILQMKVVDLNYIYILCHTAVYLYDEP
jgi:hypothetical protein